MIKSSVRYSYKRLNHSEYQGKNFLEDEKAALHSIAHLDPDADNIILITNTKTDTDKISPEILKRTKLLIHPNSGHDNISKKFIEDSNFPILVGNTIRADAVSNYILSCLLSHYSPIPTDNIWIDGRNYKRRLLSQLNILIIGHGYIGTILGKSLQALCGNLTIFDPYIKEHGHSFNQLSEFNLESFDVIIMACSLNKSSYQIINKSVLSRLKKNITIINAARGKLIQESELIHFLCKNPQAFAYLDVFEIEPLRQSKDIWPINCLKTSHIAGVYTNLDTKIIEFEEYIINIFINDRNNFKKLQDKFSIINHLC